MHLSQNLHILCAFKSKLAHTLCTFKPKFAHTLCANKACQKFKPYDNPLGTQPMKKTTLVFNHTTFFLNHTALQKSPCIKNGAV